MELLRGRRDGEGPGIEVETAGLVGLDGPATFEPETPSARGDTSPFALVGTPDDEDARFGGLPTPLPEPPAFATADTILASSAIALNGSNGVGLPAPAVPAASPSSSDVASLSTAFFRRWMVAEPISRMYAGRSGCLPLELERRRERVERCCSGEDRSRT